jgi:hypothetical protein
MVHEGNVYFEHCYGAEFNDRVTPMEREACWSAWLADYTRHQPAHRIDYAMRRIEAIQAGDQTLKLPGVAGGLTSAPSEPGVVTARPTLRAPRVGAEVATTVSRDADAGAVGHGCQAACQSYEQSCLSTCPPVTSDCRLLCVREKAICREGCY